MTAHSEIKRDKRLIIPVTDEERAYIKEMVSRTCYGSVANFCREVLFQVCKEIESVEYTGQESYAVDMKAYGIEEN